MDFIRVHYRMGATMVMRVRDELVFECHKDDAEFLKVLVKKAMELAADLKVPLMVDVGVGMNMNWGEARGASG